MRGTFLSKLFGSAPKTETEMEQEPESQAKPEIKAEVSPSEPVPLRLSFSPEHAVNRLWSIRTKSSGWLSGPEFILSVPAGHEDLLPPAKAEKELPRLHLAVSMAANKRISAVEVKGKQQEEAPPPPDLDAQATVFLSGDNMLAWLFVFPPVGKGKELDRAILEAALEEKQVRYGLAEGLLDRIPQDPDRYFHLFHAACGTPAENGKDGHIIDRFPRKVEKKPTIDENDRIDYMSLNFIQNVEEGEIICQIVPPVPGKAGRTVQDKEIPAKQVRAAPVPKGRNTELSEDGGALIATKTGNVEFTGRAFQVKSTLEIGGDVDYSTGNLNFLGDIHIHGNISDGFSVRATGSITVNGVVGACHVETGGDLIMSKGANGNDKAVFRVGGSLYAKYLENCSVYAKEAIYADCIINCSVYCDGNVEVRSGRGVILGGSIRATHEVSASVVGSRSGHPTEIFLGGLPCQTFDHENLIREINNKQNELLQTEQQPDSPTKSATIAKLNIRLSADRMKLEQMAKDLEQMEKAKESPGLRRLICNIAYQGTSVTIGDASRRLQREVYQCTAILADGEIHLR